MVPGNTAIYARLRRGLVRAPRLILLLALGWLVLVFLVAVFADLLAPAHYETIDLRNRLAPPSFAWGKGYFLGTDHLGRDVLSRLFYATRISLLIALVGTVVGAAVGTAIGISAAHFRGIYDEVVMLLVDFQAAVPFMIIALAVLAFFGNSFFLFLLLIGLQGWEGYARMARGLTNVSLTEGYALAVRALGAGYPRVYARHVTPNLVSAMVVQMTLTFPSTILLETSLSFLGLGVQPPMTSLGSMLGIGRNYLSSAWWIALFPGLLIFLTTLSMSLAGDWLRDRLDPRLRDA